VNPNDADAIVFDLDGVLVDSMPAIRAAWSAWARRHGISADAVLASIHLTATELVRKFAPTLDPASEAAAVADDQVDLEAAVTAYPGSAELLRSLPPERWAIVTSARRELARRHLRLANLPIPDVLVCAEDVARGKPEPDGYLDAAAGLGRAPHRCVAVEDSPAGVRAARAAGMHVVAVASTHAPSELREAHEVIQRLSEWRVDVLTDGLRISRTSAWP